ncbi:MAG: glycosyltransferase family 4 protein [Patescibacteria group bacterium]
MRIIYFANTRMPNEKAHGTQLAKMCEAFVEAGVDLTLVVPRRGIQNPRSIRDFYGLRKDIKIHYLPIPHFGSSRNLFNLEAFCFGIASFVVALGERIRNSSTIIYTIDLDQFSYFLLPLAGLPVFFECHGSKVQSLFFIFFIKRVKKIIAVSGGVARSLFENYKIDTRKILVASNAIDQNFSKKILPKDVARDKFGIAKDVPVALYLGKFYDWKGLDVLVRGAVLLPGIQFILVGDTIERLLEVTGESKISANVLVIGEVPHFDVPAMLSCADVLLLTGTAKNRYSYFETSPMKVFEYAATRIPVISARTPAVEEICGDGAYYYEPDSVDSFVEAVSRSFGNREEAEVRADSLYAKIGTYSWNERTSRILQAINTK